MTTTSKRPAQFLLNAGLFLALILGILNGTYSSAFAAGELRIVPDDGYALQTEGSQSMSAQGALTETSLPDPFPGDFAYYHCYPQTQVKFWASAPSPCHSDDSCAQEPPPSPCYWTAPHTGYNAIVASVVAGGDIPVTSIEIDPTPVQGSNLTGLSQPLSYPYTLWWFYHVTVNYSSLPVGLYSVQILINDTQGGSMSCSPYVDNPSSSTKRLWLYNKPIPPSCFGEDEGSRLGCGSDSFQGGGCSSCGGGGDFPCPSITNPVVYQPVSAPNGLMGPMEGMIDTGPSGCHSSWIEVTDTCTYLPPYTPDTSKFYARVKDRCGKCYLLYMGARPPTGYYYYDDFQLDDGTLGYLEFYTDGSTYWSLDYPDRVYEEFYVLSPPEGKWVIGSGPYLIRDADSNETDITYDVEQGGLVYDEAVTPDNSTWRYHHASGDSKITKIEQVTSGASTVEIGYDQGQPSQVRVKDGSGNTVSQTDYTYENGKIKTATRGSRKVEYTFTENNQVITVRDLDQSQAAMTETVYDFRTAATTTVTQEHLAGPGQDQTTTFSFYTSGSAKTYVHTRTDPDNKVTTYDVNTSNGRVNWVQDPTGLRTTYSYNSKGAVTTTTYSKTDMTTYHEENIYYLDAGSNETIWLKTHESIHPADDSSRGNFTYYIRNASTLWHLDAVKVDPVGSREPTQQQWDAIDPSRSYQYYGTSDSDGLPGQLKTETTPNIEGATAYLVTYKYTESGGKRRESPVQTIYKDSAYADKASFATYDDTGNVLSSTDANSRTVQYHYDALGRATTTVYGTGIQSENHYTCCTMDWSKDEDGRTTYYAYDDMNRVKKTWTEIPGQSQSAPLVENSYDAFGNTLSTATRSNATTARATGYTYDSNNRVTRVDYPGPLGHEEFGYDSVGNLWWKKDGNGAVTLYRYDDLHRMTDVYYNYTGALPPTGYPAQAQVSYTYYGATALVHTMTDDSGQSSYIYDGRDQLTSYTPPQPSSRTITYDYNNLGQKKSMVATGLSVYYNYFANGWLKDVRRNSQTGSLVASYGYDPVGVRTRVDFGNSTWQTFGYDADPRYRLANIHYAYNCGSGIADQGGLSLTRDNTGNPLTWGDADNKYGRAYTYDKNSRLKSANLPGGSAANYTYDWAGNRHDAGSSYNAADQLVSRPGHTYQYDGAGNMTYDNSVHYTYTPSGLLSTAGNSSMVWDASGNRVRFTSSTDQGNPYTFVYDPTAGIPAVIEEVHSGASVYYLRELDGSLIARVSGSDTKYYHSDDLGSTLMLTGADGTVSDRYTYDAWGNVTHTGNTSQPYQYVGQEGYYTHYQDPNLSLQQVGLRFYDPQSGRFTQEDMIDDEGTAYEYVGSNPISSIDPLGLSSHGGPWHPPKGVKTKCRYGDSASDIAGKIWLLEKMIRSHSGWRTHHPEQGAKHLQELQELMKQLAECKRLQKQPQRCPVPVPVPVPETSPQRSTAQKVIRGSAYAGTAVVVGIVVWEVVKWGGAAALAAPTGGLSLGLAAASP